MGLYTIFYLSTFLLTGGRLKKRRVLTELVHQLSDAERSRDYTVDQLEQILNVVVVDHSLTGCLLALAYPAKKTVS